MSTEDTDLQIEFDDEHPLFTRIWEDSKAARQGHSPLLPASSVPEALTIELRVGDTVQQFGLLNVADTTWKGGRMRMRTRWIGTPPTTVTPAAPTTEEKPA